MVSGIHCAFDKKYIINNLYTSFLLYTCISHHNNDHRVRSTISYKIRHFSTHGGFVFFVQMGDQSSFEYYVKWILKESWANTLSSICCVVMDILRGAVGQS